MPAKFCAVCITDIVGEYRMEPIGRDDALVAVCMRCACASVKFAEPRVKSRQQRDRDMDRLAVHLREYRLNLKLSGLCINGPSHGPATHGAVCLACRQRRDSQRDSRRDPRREKRARSTSP